VGVGCFELPDYEYWKGRVEGRKLQVKGTDVIGLLLLGCVSGSWSYEGGRMT